MNGGQHGTTDQKYRKKQYLFLANRVQRIFIQRKMM